MSDSNNPDQRKQTLRFYLGRLKERSGLCSNATNEILQYHVQFASLMAQPIDDASESQYDLIDDDLETTRLAKDIRKASSSLSTNVERMTYELESFVCSREGTGHDAKGTIAGKADRLNLCYVILFHL